MPKFKLRTFALQAVQLSLCVTAAAQTQISSPNPEISGIFGAHVVNIPDITGDSREEFAVAAYLEDPGASPSGAGRVYLYNGSTRLLLRTLVSPNEESGGNFGSAIAGMADMNGDGRGDILVGAYGESPGASPDDAGRAYLIDGNTGAVLRTFVSPNEEIGGSFGANLDAVPDVTGDGRPDVVIGGYAEDPGVSPPDAGRAYIFNGMSGALVAELVSANEENGGWFGLEITGVPDVTGDSMGDVIVGAELEDRGVGLDEAGRSYLFNGATGALVRTLLSPNPCKDGSFGCAAAGLGDLTGDNLSEIAVAANFEDIPPFSSHFGRVYVFNGATGVLMTSLSSPNGETQGMFGDAISISPDMSGDGRPDLLIGAPEEDPGLSPDLAGRAYLFDAYNGVLLHTFVSPNEESGGAFGFDLSSIGDLTGDGSPDFIIGAPIETGASGFALSGRAYIFTDILRNSARNFEFFE